MKLSWKAVLRSGTVQKKKKNQQVLQDFFPLPGFRDSSCPWLPASQSLTAEMWKPSEEIFRRKEHKKSKAVSIAFMRPLLWSNLIALFEEIGMSEIRHRVSMNYEQMSRRTYALHSGIWLDSTDPSKDFLFNLLFIFKSVQKVIAPFAGLIIEPGEHYSPFFSGYRKCSHLGSHSLTDNSCR